MTALAIKANVSGRPRTFDKRLMDYEPALRSMAYRYWRRDREKASDLYVDTVAHCLERWEGFREEGGFHGWISWAMRDCYNKQRAAIRRQVSTVSNDTTEFGEDGGYSFSEFHEGYQTQPNQEHAAILADVLRYLSGERYGADVIKFAMEYTTVEIAEESGDTNNAGRPITRQAVHKRILDVVQRMKEAS